MMQKITLLITFLLTSILGVQSQETISFETSEGYTLGNIFGQSNWVTTQDSDTGDYITSQTVSSEFANVGTNALKLVTETTYNPQTFAIVGAFYNYPTPISNANTSFSVDFYMTEQGGNSKSFLFGLVDSASLAYRTYINFDYNGDVDVLVMGDTPGMIIRAAVPYSWNPGVWMNVKIKTEGPVVKFFIDNVEVYTDNLVSNGAIDQVRFAHDNYDGTIYVDNFTTFEEPLSVNEFDANTVTHFYDKNTQALILRSNVVNFTGLKVYNLLGQEVLSSKLSQKNETVDFSTFANGVYIVDVNNGAASTTIKVLKH